MLIVGVAHQKWEKRSGKALEMCPSSWDAVIHDGWIRNRDVVVQAILHRGQTT